MDLLAARELELGPAEGLNHMLLVLQLGADRYYDWPMWALAVVPWGFPKAPHSLSGASTEDSMPSHECPLERVVFKIP